MKQILIIALLMLVGLLGALGIAQTSGQREGTTGTMSQDTGRSGTMGHGHMDMGTMSQSDMMMHMNMMVEQCDNMYSDWHAIYTHYHELLEITDRERLREEMERHHQMVNAFNAKASEMHESHQMMMQSGGMQGRGSDGRILDRSGSTINPDLDRGMTRDTSLRGDTIWIGRDTVRNRGIDQPRNRGGRDSDTLSQPDRGGRRGTDTRTGTQPRGRDTSDTLMERDTVY